MSVFLSLPPPRKSTFDQIKLCGLAVRLTGRNIGKCPTANKIDELRRGIPFHLCIILR
jgi:hypothetical protein